jgi:hypothetical protein
MMFKVTVTFYGMLYGAQKAEWTITPENSKAVSATITYLLGGHGMKMVKSIDISPLEPK